MKQLVISVDFDGTIVEFDYPRIGKPLPGAFETLRDLIAAGHKLILNTCREDVGHNINKQYLKEAVEFCRQNGVEFVSVNENRPHEDYAREDWPVRRKVWAHVYIDDKNFGGFPGWDVIRKELLG